MSKSQVIELLQRTIDHDSPIEKKYLHLSPEMLNSLPDIKELLKYEITRPTPEESFFTKLYVVLSSGMVKSYYSNGVIHAKGIPNWVLSLLDMHPGEVTGFATVLTPQYKNLQKKALAFCE